jgi:hypothetical protein
MVGRLVVGRPIGPGSLPFDWYQGTAEGTAWVAVPEAARAAFPTIHAIMKAGVVAGRTLPM